MPPSIPRLATRARVSSLARAGCGGGGVGSGTSSLSRRALATQVQTEGARPDVLQSVLGSSRVHVDEGTANLLHDMNLGAGRRKTGAKSHHRAELQVTEDRQLTFDDAEDLEAAARDPRRSPAAIFGSKRIGMVVLPDELVLSVQSRIDEHEDPKLLRQAYLSQVTSSNPSAPRMSSSLQDAMSPASDSKQVPPGKKNAVTPLGALVAAAVDLPGEYSAVKNVLSELEVRLGEEEMAKLTAAGGEVPASWIVLDGGVGSGAWAALEHLRLLPSQQQSQAAQSSGAAGVTLQNVHASRHLSEMSRTLLGDDLAGESGLVRHNRNLSEALSASTVPPRVILSTFQLSQVPTTAGRAARVQEMWDTGADTLILIDKGNKEGFRALSEARAQLLSLGRKTRADGTTISNKASSKSKKMESSEDVLRLGGETFFAEGLDSESSRAQTPAVAHSEAIGSHVVAPCPHDGPCPLATTTKDICRFSQRIQSPRFMRKTKHSSSGEAGLHYSYVVIRRGARPMSATQEAGRKGGVAKDAEDRERRKLTERSVGKIVPVVGGPEGSYEVIRQSDELPAAASSSSSPSFEESKDVSESLRQEAYRWPRLVYPPLKRSGHVVMDTCHPSSAIVRLTLPKSQSKQAYYDARKVSWGDLFPHNVKGTAVVRRRGFATASRLMAPNTSYREETHPDDVSPSATRAMIDDHSQYLLNTYARPPILFTHGKGCKLYSSSPSSSPDHGSHGTTREYLDFTAGIAVNALGHGDEQIATLLKEQQEMLSHSSNVCWNEWAGELAKLLVENTRQHGGLGLNVAGQSKPDRSAGGRVFFSNSGTEANEGALKFARKYGKEVESSSSNKTALVCFNNAFHGRSMGALSVTPNPKYQDPFAPLIPNVRVGDLNDIEALDRLIDEDVCGVIIEPIQGEGGLNAPTDEFLIALAKRARQVKAVVIHDEIQCGLFRTGNMWGHGHLPLDAQADIVTMAKPLANGYPIGAIMVRDHVADKVTVGSHGTTFGGQVLGTRLGAHVITRLSDPTFIANQRETAAHLAERLDRLPAYFPEFIPSEIRGRGMMRGIPFSQSAAPGELVKRARQRGVLLLTAGSDAVRIIPSLNVSKAECDKAVDVIESCLTMMKEENWGM